MSEYHTSLVTSLKRRKAPVLLVVLLSLFLLLPLAVHAQTQDGNFYLHANGVTIVCDAAAIGDTGIINGTEYTKRSRDQITTTNATATCTSGITNMKELFKGKVSFNGNIGHWDVSSVTDMSGMFTGLWNNGHAFNQDIGSWDVSNVTDMNHMFYRALDFNQDIGGWDVSSVTDMSSMFYDASIFNQDISGWNVSNVTNMSSMFRGSSSYGGNSHAFNADISGWNVSNVTDMSYMFHYARKFNQNIGGWDVGSVTNMSHMFYYAGNFNQNIGGWDVSNVTSMGYMFYLAYDFNQDIGGWDVSSVTDMSGMFYDASIFSQDIGGWNVSNVTDMSSMFRASNGNSHAFNADISGWNVGKVTNMSYMFSNASAFNADIGGWDVRSVMYMSYMFSNASFWADISSWNVGNVLDMDGMFHNAEYFMGDISSWCVYQIVPEPIDFSLGSPLLPENGPQWGTCTDRPKQILRQAPIYDAEEQLRKLTFAWQADTKATAYQLQVQEPGNQIVIDTVTSELSYQVQNSLKLNQLYYWRVRGINETQRVNGKWSFYWGFTTERGIVVLQSPANGSDRIDYSPTLSWYEQEDAVSYSIQVSTDGFNSFVVNENNLQETSFTTPELSYETTYEWRVRAIKEGITEEEWSRVWSFTTLPAPVEYTASLPGSNPGWRMVGSPILNDTYASLFSSVWTQGIPGADSENGTPNLYYYDEAGRSFSAPANLDNSLGYGITEQSTTGRGVLAYIYEDDDYDGQSNDWPKVLKIQGTSYSDDVNLSLSNTVADPDDGQQGWHLVSNPFSFPIDWKKVVADGLTNVSPAIFIYDANTLDGQGGYRVHYGYDIPSLPGTINHSGILAPFQGFWVRTSKMDGTPGTLTFKESHAATGNGTLYKGSEKVSETSTKQEFIALSLTNENQNVALSAVMQFSDDTLSVGLPQALSETSTLFGWMDSTNSVYSLKNSSMSDFQRQAPSLGFSSSLTDNFTIQLSEVHLRNQEVELWIVDHETNERHQLSEKTPFVFEHTSKSKKSNDPVYEESTPEFSLVRNTSSISDLKPRFSIEMLITTSIDEEAELPTEWILFQNFPNPFNPTTVITYHLPISNQVTLKVFDMLGREVTTLVDRRISAGMHEVSFDASNLSSGLYIYRLQAGDITQTKQMMLIK